MSFEDLTEDLAKLSKKILVKSDAWKMFWVNFEWIYNDDWIDGIERSSMFEWTNGYFKFLKREILKASFCFAIR